MSTDEKELLEESDDISPLCPKISAPPLATVVINPAA